MTPYPKALERFPTIRQSRLSTFDRCALSAAFEEQYQHGWASHPQARGTIFHRVAAKALTQMYEQNERTIPTDAAIAILDETLRQHDIDRVCPECGKQIVKRADARIVCSAGHDHRSDLVNLPFEEIKDLRWVVVKWAAENAFDIQNLVDVEHRLSAVIRYQAVNGEYVERELTGALDALFVTGAQDDEFIVLDWKDTWGLPGPTALGFDGYFQQRFYAWLVFRNFPSARKVTLREFYVRFSEAREATVYREDIEDIEAELAALAERFDRAFEESNFPPSPGQHCQVCARPSACPIFPAARIQGAVDSAQMAERVAREVTVAEVVLTKRKEALAAWTSVHGPQEVSSHKGRRVWGHKQIKRTSRPKREDLERALGAQRAGVPLNMDELYRESKGTRFELHAPQEHEDVDPTADDAALMSALEASVEAAKVAPPTKEDEAA